jgi:hypothetical protein
MQSRQCQEWKALLPRPTWAVRRVRGPVIKRKGQIEYTGGLHEHLVLSFVEN